MDDTPETVVISGFDPVRREVARLSLERLIQDGRIHPTRIEEIVSKAQKDVNKAVKDAGEQAILELGLARVLCLRLVQSRVCFDVVDLDHLAIGKSGIGHPHLAAQEV